jgi:hypothetical protein
VIGCGVVIHGAVVCGALAHSLYMIDDRDLALPRPNQSALAKGQTSASSKVVGTVLTMYSQGCVNEASCHHTVTFEDPAARTEGFAELKEAFRMLKRLEPETVDWEIRKVSSDVGQVELNLWQRYSLLEAQEPIDLYSHIVVQHDDQGRIISMQDRWKGKPLLPSTPFGWTRRLNGIVSFQLTPFFDVDMP